MIFKQYLFFSLLALFSYSASASQVKIFGPQKVDALPQGKTVNYSILNNSTQVVPGSLVIQNGDGTDQILSNCDGLKGLAKAACVTGNAAVRFFARFDRPKEYSIKWNDGQSIHFEEDQLLVGQILIPISVRANNNLKIEIKGLFGSSIKVTVNAESSQQVNLLPTAQFTPTPSSGIAPELILFNGMLSFDPDGSIVSYEWDFGDNTTGSGTVVSHQYNAAGEYTVKLTVTDNQSGIGVQTQTISILANQLPNASFSYVILENSATNHTLQFDGSTSSDPDGTIISYQWDFGDNTTSTLIRPTHSYQNYGSYQVSLTVTDNKNGSQTTTQTVVITDTIAPTLTSNISSNLITSNPNFHLSVNDQSETTTEIYKDNILQESTSEKEIDLTLSEGLHSYQILAKDQFNNISTPLNLENIKLDTIAPVINATVPLYTASTSVSISVDVTDASNTTTEVKMDNVLLTSTADKNFTYLVPLGSDGLKTIEITSTDEVGNTSTITKEITKNTQPLAVQVISPQSGAIYNNQVIEVRLVSNKPLQSVLINGLPATISDDHLSVKYFTQIITEGFFTIQIQATDQFGGTYATSVQAELKLNSLASWTYEECPVQQ